MHHFQSRFTNSFAYNSHMNTPHLLANKYIACYEPSFINESEVFDKINTTFSEGSLSMESNAGERLRLAKGLLLIRWHSA